MIEELCKRKNISITLWGDGIEQQKWMEWYKEVKELFGCLGYVHTHIGIQSASYKNGKVMTVNRKEKEILSKLDKGEEPENLSLYSLTGDYKVAMFDYDVLCVRDKEYLSFVLNEECYNEYNVNLLISMLKKYVDYEYGEIYSVSREELPLIYAETRDIRNLDTYEFIKKIS